MHFLLRMDRIFAQSSLRDYLDTSLVHPTLRRKIPIHIYKGSINNALQEISIDENNDRKTKKLRVSAGPAKVVVPVEIRGHTTVKFSKIYKFKKKKKCTLLVRKNLSDALQAWAIERLFHAARFYYVISFRREVRACVHESMACDRAYCNNTGNRIDSRWKWQLGGRNT